MAITVVGSVAFDTVESPAGRRERCLAGAATYFSLSASFFTDVRVIAIVGEEEELRIVISLRDPGLEAGKDIEFCVVCLRFVQILEV